MHVVIVVEKVTKHETGLRAWTGKEGDIKEDCVYSRL